MEPSTAESNLYPKITNHMHEVVQKLQDRLRDPEFPEIDPIIGAMPIVGTVKLHGTHADILVYHDNSIVLQSRNNANLLATADNAGFAAAMAQKHETILALRDILREGWKFHHPNEVIDRSQPIVFAGEWIGEKIQKGVAIAKLSRRFVIVSMKVNGRWVPDSLYMDIEAPAEGIYNIARGGFYNAYMHGNDLEVSVKELGDLAEEVAACCPFAKSFGILGEGEGIVWKLSEFYTDSSLWFKTKGGRFKPTFTPAPKPLPADDTAERDFAATLAMAWCSGLRLEQGWDYLREKGIPQNMRGIGAFLKWVQTDILVEEKLFIEGNQVDERFLRAEIIAIAKPWFLDRYERGEE